MSKKMIIILLVIILVVILISAYFILENQNNVSENYTENNNDEYIEKTENITTNQSSNSSFTLDSTVGEVINDKAFAGFGNLIFPVDKDINPNTSLRDVCYAYTWYNNINPNKTVEIVNYLKTMADEGNTIFYDIYTDEEKAENLDKENTGLFFFKGNPGEKFAVVSSGGGMVYVGAIADSFPHCLELSKKGYNAFAIIYRPGYQTAPEDLARAVAFIHEHADELQVDVSDYSLWGGSVGARMAAWVGNGTEKYGEKAYPRPAAVIMQYTALTEVTGEEPPTYNCVGTRDGIAPYQTMQERINRIKANGTDTQIEIFEGLPHGFGLGEGTSAEGWID